VSFFLGTLEQSVGNARDELSEFLAANRDVIDHGLHCGLIVAGQDGLDDNTSMVRPRLFQPSRLAEMVLPVGSRATCLNRYLEEQILMIRRLYAVQEPFQKATAHRQDHAGRMAIQAELLRRLNRRPHDQSGPSALHGEADGAKTIEVKASYLALISHPDEIAGLIAEAAGGAR
jgi:hypothetical protein